MSLDKFLRMVDTVYVARTSSEPTQPSVAAANPQPQQQSDTEPESEPEGPVQAKTLHMFYVTDDMSNTQFLIDTGACKSFIPANPHEHLDPTPSTLQVSTASGALLKIYGKITKKLSFNGKPYSWTFITADITIALLGADFLKAHDMLTDVGRQRLIQRQGPIAPTIPRTTANPTSGPEICCLLQEFSKVFKGVLQHDLTSPVKHHIKHHNVTKGPPVHARFRHLGPDKLA
ncbi:uncharacterized protein [Macrobrachium rosenbergii]|uniref:uncharacterized protein n=1 Tax=Macrobrachium rosenbergii TaxID=79674 RepID=UPI0034D496B6